MVEQILASLELSRLQAEPYYFRTSDGVELDLLLAWAEERWALEIKLTSHPTKAMVDGLNKAADLTGASRRILVCHAVEEIRSGKLLIKNLPSFLKELATMPVERR